jgi:N-acetylated-alpha-linked acidic dipeptidase
LLALLFFSLAAGPAGRSAAPPTGFSESRGVWERDYELHLLALPQPAECGALLREITSETHMAGTPGDERVADLIAREYRQAGLAVEMPTYDVLLSYPKSNHLEIVGEPEIRLGRGEEPIAADPDTRDPYAAIPWNAYAASGSVEAEVVYVNRGSPRDYERLARLGVSVKGKIALARYFGGYRGGKSLEAEKQGVAAVLVYSDPIDDGWFKGEVYPDGPWGPESHLQRGADVYDFLIPGDPLTPGWASLPGAKRIPESESRILPKIPMMPLSARDAAEILKRLGGPAVPEGWQGVALPATYRVGPGPVRLALKVENTREVRTIRNVVGVLKGTDEPSRQILLSNHHDAWGFGAVDPSSGTATMIALARALGELARAGFKPRRSIVFGSWDAEEYTLTGSTEWGEEHERELEKNAVVCLNVDAAASGRDLSASASPLLFSPLREAARDVEDPNSPGRSLAEAWRESAGKTNIRSYATGATGDDLPVAILGSGSDYTVFFNRLGIPSADLIFDGPFGVYHSIYDDYRWMATFGDPGFRYHAAMAKYVGVLALRFANADVLPFDAPAYGREIARYTESLGSGVEDREVGAELGLLAQRARAWSEEASRRQGSALKALASGKASARELAAANNWMMSLERALLAEDGIPNRPWFRHLVYAPLPSYEAETLPAIREALAANRPDLARGEIRRLRAKIESAIAAAKVHEH